MSATAPAETATASPVKGNVAAAELRQFVERVERLEEEKKTISDDIRDVFAEMKGRGYDVKAVRQLLKIRKQDANEREEQEAILDVYLQALGMI
ncbi:DUF2312 domain-containing protein [Afipia felis]|uniref:UPF0335 protein NCTC12722_01054 n=2 Tax=Afipia felis TaxID=1035 RepID=A0A380W6T5_AFIFE|nr:DUF2312 domain-containing protein [Afipia felis]EKS31064.1 hypothetical protein HMPREF9697_03592 [Afipia felis ATCC 53690]SUU75808.1 Uncharacterized protein conserved in bacteria (DUF2312) [Afipia felis]SUU83875.1 Uncharacterized protein conserved in bacteria (DUF2312) [Afipia felis]